MLKTFKKTIREFLDDAPPLPAINEESLLHEIAQQYPDAYDFVDRKYGLSPSAEDKGKSLKVFSEKYGLPPPQILFMEIQMDARSRGVKELTPKEANALIKKNPDLLLLDVREDWEIKICSLKDSKQLTAQVLDVILSTRSKDTPILLYCHFGIRSMDAAAFLVDRGFTNVYSLRGGIDAWSVEIEPEMQRYQNAYC